jgi:delta-aminolevulinic acid dehydratase/porphobilinogen synthase
MERMSIPLVRKYLRENPDGLTARELAIRIFGDEGRQSGVNKSISAMPDVYRDRWARIPGAARYAAVYCIVEVPADCPHPREMA